METKRAKRVWCVLLLSLGIAIAGLGALSPTQQDGRRRDGAEHLDHHFP